jgi:Glycosyltransferases involved in cell wall biogenesis
MKSKKTISIVVPIYNELAVLPVFFERLVSVIMSLNKYDFEIIIVNDGSSDGSYEYLLKKKTEYSNIVIVDLSRNFGKEAALTAGIDVSVGDALIPIDCDLQDPPELIRDLILQWESGFEVVEAKRSERNVDSFFKKYSANFFYFVMNFLNQGKITGNVGDFRIIDRKVVESIKLLDERNRYMKGI